MYEEIIYDVDDSGRRHHHETAPRRSTRSTDRTQAEIRHALDQSERNEDVIGTVLTGAGRGFCSGVDMNALGAMSEAGRRLGDSYAELAADPGNPDSDPNFEIGAAYFLGLRKPLIAAINGACAGLGFSYAVFCDMRFADRTARFVTSFSQRGLIAEHGVSWMLPRLIGPANALDILWTGRRFDGEEGARLGLVNRVCEPGECVNDAVEYLREIGRTAAPNSLMMMKRQIYRHLNAELRPAMLESNDWMDESLARGDFKEGVASFVERRAPNFARLKVD